MRPLCLTYFRRSLLRVAAVIVTLRVVSLCAASLGWETKLVELTAKRGDREAIASFPFKNMGKTTIAIRDLQTSCECTVAELAKRTYAPGESGTIKAVFTVGDRMGRQERTVTVTMDDPYAPVAVLTMRVEIPELLAYSARLLHWSVGGDTGEKFVEVSATGGNRIAAIEVKEATPKLAEARVEVVENGRKYRLFIQPVQLKGPATIPITFVARFEGGGQHSFTFYALVR